MWWCIITLTTVGYGDVVPLSPLGKAIASCTAVTGAIVLAFPVTVLGINIVAVRDEYKTKEESDKWEAKLRAADRSGINNENVISNLQEEYDRLCSDITNLEATTKSLTERKERLGILLNCLRDRNTGKEIHRS